MKQFIVLSSETLEDCRSRHQTSKEAEDAAKEDIQEDLEDTFEDHSDVYYVCQIIQVVRGMKADINYIIDNPSTFDQKHPFPEKKK